MATVTIELFTDPNCPFAFSAERQRHQLLWIYGDGVEVRTRMIVLSEDPSVYEQRGFTPERMAEGLSMLQARYGMPINTTVRDRIAPSIDACRAFIGARMHRPDRAEALLRALRVEHMGGRNDDAPEVIGDAAVVAGLERDEVLAWIADPEVRAATDVDRDAARAPVEEALALPHKLAKWEGGMRYTAPSMVLRRADRHFALPGFQPFESIEAAIANLAPELPRRSAPTSVTEVLEWAPWPLATAEVAAVCSLSLEAAGEQLAQVASFSVVGEDGYWTLMVA